MDFSTRNFIAFIIFIMLLLFGLCLSILINTPSKIDLHIDAKHSAGKISSLIFNENDIQFSLDDDFSKAFYKALSKKALHSLQTQIDKNAEVNVYYNQDRQEEHLLHIVQLEKDDEVLISKNLIEQKNSHTRMFTMIFGVLGLTICCLLLFGKFQIASILQRKNPNDGISFPALFLKKNMAAACYTDPFLIADRRLAKQVYQNCQFIDAKGKRHYVKSVHEDSKLLLLSSMQKIGAMMKFKPSYEKPSEQVSFEELKGIIEIELKKYRGERHGKTKEEYALAIRNAKDYRDLIMILN